MNSGIVKVVVGDYQILIIGDDGSLWVMGEDWFDQDDLNRAGWAPEPVKVLESGVLDVAAGRDHLLILREDKSVWSIGDNEEGQLGHREPVVSFARKILDGEVKEFLNRAPVANAGPDLSSLNGDGSRGGKVQLDGSASKDDWQVESWRWTWDGKTMEGRFLDAYFDEGETEVTLEVFDSEGLSDTDSMMVNIGPESRVAKVETGTRHTLVLEEDGSLWASGSHVQGQLGIGEMSLSTPLHLMKSQEFVLVEPGEVVFIRTVDNGGFFVKEDGSLWGMGEYGSGFFQEDIGLGVAKEPTRLIDSGVSEIHPDRQHSLLLMKDGSLWGIGDNQYGQLGVESEGSHQAPVLIVEGGVDSATARGDSSLFVRNDGSLWGMGRNEYGQLGDGTNETRFRPVEITSSGVRSVSLASTYSVRLEDDQRVFVAGRVPVSSSLEEKAEYLGVSDAVMAKAFEDHYMVLRESGALLAVGRHQGWSSEGFETPTEVYSGRVRDFVYYWSRTFLVLKDGSLWGIGYDGDNDGAFGRSVPRELQELTELLRIDFDTWLRRFFTSEEIADIGGDVHSADPDNDGIANRIEIEWNLNPSVKFDPFRDSLSRFRVGRGAPKIEVTRYASGLDYQVWYTEDFKSWRQVALPWHVVEESILLELPNGLSGFFKVVPSQ